MTAQLPGAAELGDDEAGLAGQIGATFDHVAMAGRRIRDMLPPSWTATCAAIPRAACTT